VADEQEGWSTEGVDPAVLEVYQLLRLAKEASHSLHDENWVLKKKIVTVGKLFKKYEPFFQGAEIEVAGESHEEVKEANSKVFFAKVRGLPAPPLKKNKPVAGKVSKVSQQKSGPTPAAAAKSTASKKAASSLAPSVKPAAKPVVTKTV